MFTGIVREIGILQSIKPEGDTKIRVRCRRKVESIEIGASIACGGVCLTVVALGANDDGAWFDVDASAETRAKTTLGMWREGDRINLEPALRLGDELGGHIVSGHVDGVAEITDITPDGDSHRVTFRAPKGLGRFVASKGSVTLDGVSLTVNEVEDRNGETYFGINVIPHTWQVTTFADAKVGKHVNFEIDVLARYVQRLAEAG